MCEVCKREIEIIEAIVKANIKPDAATALAMMSLGMKLLFVMEVPREEIIKTVKDIFKKVDKGYEEIGGELKRLKELLPTLIKQAQDKAKDARNN